MDKVRDALDELFVKNARAALIELAEHDRRALPALLAEFGDGAAVGGQK